MTQSTRSNVYIDIDGVCLRNGKPAPHCFEFLRWASEIHRPYWLTTCDSHGQHDGILRAFRHAIGSPILFSEIEALLRAVRPTDWSGSRTTKLSKIERNTRLCGAKPELCGSRTNLTTAAPSRANCSSPPGRGVGAVCPRAPVADRPTAARDPARAVVNCRLVVMRSRCSRLDGSRSAVVAAACHRFA